jgi:hypothetical protein
MKTQKKFYWKDLSKKERKHLRDFGVYTLGQFKEMAENQRINREAYKDYEPCWTCKRIAEKLGLEV